MRKVKLGVKNEKNNFVQLQMSRECFVGLSVGNKIIKILETTYKYLVSKR
jgi:hypothetical protein